MGPTVYKQRIQFCLRQSNLTASRAEFTQHAQEIVLNCSYLRSSSFIWKFTNNSLIFNDGQQKSLQIIGSGPRGGYFTVNSYGGVRRKDLCYDPIPEIWSDIDTHSLNLCQILIPNRRNNKKKNNSTSKGQRTEGLERVFWFQMAI